MRKLRLVVWLGLLYLGLIASLSKPTLTQADAADAWWDNAWPYRLPVTVSGKRDHQ
jgi:hypothetical protein